MDYKKDDLFSLDRLDDLPEDLKNELNALKRDIFEKNIIALFEKAQRELTLDEVLVGYFRMYNESKDRRTMMNKLYNMATNSQHPAIKKVEGRKGVYKLKEEESKDDIAFI